ncbi:MAG: hypothetical protein KGK15_15220 [Burkholderiales bacterium]|nr:hypothetical protein [Burkholderiales bacterium]
MKLLSILIRASTCACLGGALAGCYTSTPQWDRQFGNAVNEATARQTLNPDAWQDQAPVVGIDGVSAKHAIDQYQKSFVHPQQDANAFTIGVGGTSAGSR